MLSKKLFRFINNLALFAMLFAGLAPSISHALSVQNGQNAFAQEICTTGGKVVKVQVFTTKGQQRIAEFSINQPLNPTSPSVSFHLEHCPFCANASIDVAVQAANTTILAILTAKAQQLSVINHQVYPHFSPLPPPAQAPPITL